MNVKLWEVWDYTGPTPRLVDTRRGKKYAIDRAKQLAPSARFWFRTHKVWPAN